ncbi:hypothetical protein C206_19711 [Pseudomonas putida TRO1]|uniref:Uncharacterized protein n=1 Tax=Pseudomonas putida TRO1 TaxID=1227924 RepID=A0AAD2ZVE1_PSEPU|nr:hypothetical protein PPUTLS46_003332 [Pseudomonas putida LS46]ENY75903.1 hypothetical protein C206_19711 [Pseudomonas putida TRO1]
MVVPGITLIGREVALGSRAPQLYKAFCLVGVSAVDEKPNRVITLDFIGFHIPLQLAFNAAQVGGWAFHGSASGIIVAVTHIRVLRTACDEQRGCPE